MLPLGRHVLAEMKGCDATRLAQLDFVRTAMLDAATASGAHIVTSSFHQFSPLGISGVVIVSESHLAIHTWPEHGFAAVDYFTCGETVGTTRALEVLQKALGALELEIVQFTRGPFGSLPSPT